MGARYHDTHLWVGPFTALPWQGYATHYLLSCSAKSQNIKLLLADMVNISSPH